ncbi:MAG: hypothetical protein ACTSUE_23505 [Promethearchaeota archaeon]
MKKGRSMRIPMGFTGFTFLSIFIILAISVTGNDAVHVNTPESLYGGIQDARQYQLQESNWNDVSLTGLRIGEVVAHGEDSPIDSYPSLISDLNYRGAILSTINTTITPMILYNYELLWIDEGGAAFSSSELDAVEDWVYSGGTFLVTADSVLAANSLTEQFNISFESVQNGTSTLIFPHPITTGVTSIFTSGVSHLNIGGQPGATECYRLNGYNVISALEFGFGRGVIVADDHVFHNYFVNDNHLLINNTFGWLGKNSLQNDFEPQLISPSVEPTGGDQTTAFNFSVTYLDPDNNYPRYINVSLNGTDYPMEKINPLDFQWNDSCEYQFITYLQSGTWEYQFSCYDGRFTNSTPTSWLVVNYTNTHVPELLDPAATPEVGTNETIFNFTVSYRDLDNNLPAMINISINGTGIHQMNELDPLDSNSMDGKIYYYTTTLDWGIYEFQINCSDGEFSNSTSWHYGPESSYFAITNNETLFHDDFENGLSQWSSHTDLWHIVDSTSTWTYPYHSPTHAMWFGEEIDGDYSNNNFGDLITNPIDLTDVNQAYLEFFHWMDSESGWDFGRVYIRQDGGSWALIFSRSGLVAPWERLVFNISNYCGSDSVEIRFNFDSDVSVYSGYRGWYIDDVKVYSGDNTTAPPPTLLLPKNNSTRFTGIHDFEWESIDSTRLGPLNYTWQIANTSDFSTIMDEVKNIPETPGTTHAAIPVNFPTGTYYWRVIPTLDIFSWKPSVPYTLHLIKNDFSPNLSGGMVNPPTGDQFVDFNFTVLYTDADDNCPSNISVLINGTPYNMSKVDPGDITYDDGCLYQYITNMTPSLYTISFECSDGKFFNSTSSALELNVTETNVVAPFLQYPVVSPPGGTNITIFEFTVSYIDIENNAVEYINVTINGTGTFPMEEVDPLDTNVMDGKLYRYSTTLDWGYYQFQMNCSDGIFSNSTQWIAELEVSPFQNDSVAPITLISPSNGSSAFNGGIVFEWNSIVLHDIGQIEYTLQLSNSSDFLALLNEVTGITGNPGTSNQTLLVNYQNGQYFWRVKPTFQNFSGNWSDPFVFELVINNFSPVINYSYQPHTGDQLTPFNFSLTYSDADNNTPQYIELIMDGTHVALSKMNSTDVNYVDGCLYSLQTIIPSGDHVVQFEVFDGRFITTSNVIDLFVNETNVAAPYLANITYKADNGIMNPSANIIFSASYVDDDNNPARSIMINISNIVYAPMTAYDPGDTNYTNGKIFYFQTHLPLGNYSFKISFSDGEFNRSTGTIAGPVIQDFKIIFNELFELSSWDSDSHWTQNPFIFQTANTCNDGNYSIAFHDVASLELSNVWSQQYDNLVLSIWLQQGSPLLGGGPGAGDYFAVEYYSNGGGWILLDVFNGSDVDGTVYEAVYHLPPNALHEGLRFRFYSFGSSNDYWFLDSVFLAGKVKEHNALFFPILVVFLVVGVGTRAVALVISIFTRMNKKINQPAVVHPAPRPTTTPSTPSTQSYYPNYLGSGPAPIHPVQEPPYPSNLTDKGADDKVPGKPTVQDYHVEEKPDPRQRAEEMLQRGIRKSCRNYVNLYEGEKTEPTSTEEPAINDTDQPQDQGAKPTRNLTPYSDSKRHLQVKNAIRMPAPAINRAKTGPKGAILSNVMKIRTEVAGKQTRGKSEASPELNSLEKQVRLKGMLKVQGSQLKSNESTKNGEETISSIEHALLKGISDKETIQASKEKVKSRKDDVEGEKRPEGEELQEDKDRPGNGT